MDVGGAEEMGDAGRLGRNRVYSKCWYLIKAKSDVQKTIKIEKLLARKETKMEKSKYEEDDGTEEKKSGNSTVNSTVNASKSDTKVKKDEKKLQDFAKQALKKAAKPLDPNGGKKPGANEKQKAKIAELKADAKKTAKEEKKAVKAKKDAKVAAKLKKAGITPVAKCGEKCMKRKKKKA